MHADVTRALLAIVALLGLAAGLDSVAGAEPQASRVIDRTMICATQVRGGIRVLVANAATGIKESSDPLIWKQHANVGVTTGFNEPLASAYAGVLTGTRGGWTFAVSSSLCRVTRANVAFSARGLTRELVGSTGSQRRCLEPPRRVLVRTRAVFQRPVSLRRDTQFGRWQASARLLEAQIAVRTPTGKPLAYARVFDDGRVRLFAAPTCYPD